MAVEIVDGTTTFPGKGGGLESNGLLAILTKRVDVGQDVGIYYYT